jgi:hypothetical protein
MGLFSNLFGNDGKDIDNALNKMKNLAEDIMDDGQINSQQNKPAAPSPAPASTSEPLNNRRPEPEYVEGPSGDSWGPNMPSEENQFNSGLSYQDYFTNIFNSEFSSYQISKESPQNRKALIFTFSQAGARKLVVEVISDKTNPYKLRKDCRAQGIPYIRYYYDHDGWWNTKSYVIRRTSKALGI